MATIIDSLLVTLGLDPKGYKKGTEEAKEADKDFNKSAKKGSKERSDLEGKAAKARQKQATKFHEQGKQVAATYRHIRNEMLGVLAVFGAGAGLVAFTKNTLTTAANLHFASKDMGVSVRQMAGYQGALRSMGGSNEEAVAILQKASSMGANLKLGKASPLFEELSKYGFHYKPGDLGNTNKMVGNIAEEFQRIDKERGRTVARQFAESAGFSQHQFDFLVQGRQAVAGQAGYFGAQSGITDAGARQAQALRVKFTEIEAKISGILRRIVVDMAPVFDIFLGYLQRFANWSKGHQGDIQRFIGNMIDDFKKIVPKINDLVSDVEAVNNALHPVAMALKAIGFALKMEFKGLETIGKAGGESAGWLHQLFEKFLGDDKKFHKPGVDGKPASTLKAAPSIIPHLNKATRADYVHMNNSNNTNTSQATFGPVTVNAKTNDMQELFNSMGLNLGTKPFVPQFDGVFE